MKNQGPSGRAVDVGRLDGAVDALLLLAQPLEVALGRRGQGFDQELERIAQDAGVEVEKERRDLGVRHEQRHHAALPQVLRDRVVVREIAVVDQRLVQPDKRMRPAGMPHPAARRVALVADPDVGLLLFEPVVARHLLGVADALEDHQVAAVREDEGRAAARAERSTRC